MEENNEFRVSLKCGRVLELPTPYGLCKMLAMHAIIMTRPSESPEHINKRATEIATKITKGK